MSDFFGTIIQLEFVEFNLHLVVDITSDLGTMLKFLGVLKENSLRF